MERVWYTKVESMIGGEPSLHMRGHLFVPNKKIMELKKLRKERKKKKREKNRNAATENSRHARYMKETPKIEIFFIKNMARGLAPPHISQK